MLNKRARTFKGHINPEGAKCTTMNTSLALFLMGSNIKPKNSFYHNADERLRQFEDLLSKEKDKDYVLGLANYFNQELGIRFSPVVMLSHLACTAKDQDLKDKIKYAVSKVFDRPDKISNAFGYKEFHEEPATMLPPFFKKALKKALEAMSDSTLKKRKMKRRQFSLADLIKILHPTPGSESRSALYKQIIENSKEISLKKETITDVLSNSSMTVSEKEQWVDENLEKMPFNAMLRNLRNIPSTSENLKLVVSKLKSALRVQNGIPKVKVCNPFDVLEAGLALEDNHYRAAISSALGEFCKGFSFGLEGKKVVIMIDVSGSMASYGLQGGLVTVAKYLSLMYPALAKSELRVFKFNESNIDVTGEYVKMANNSISDPVRHYGSFLNMFHAHGGTALVRCTKEAIDRENPDAMIIFSDEVTWADNGSTHLHRMMEGHPNNITNTMMRADIPCILVNPSVTQQTAIFDSDKVLRMSSLDAKIFYYLNMISNVEAFKEYIREEFLNQYEKSKLKKST